MYSTDRRNHVLLATNEVRKKHSFTKVVDVTKKNVPSSVFRRGCIWFFNDERYTQYHQNASASDRFFNLSSIERRSYAGRNYTTR